jgi:RNA polymerase sigma-70 factor (ECF subfamily)
MQETLLRACANLGRFRQSCKFSTWISAIGINAALTVIRKRKSRRESDIEPYSPDEPRWDIADQAPDPEPPPSEGTSWPPTKNAGSSDQLL